MSVGGRRRGRQRVACKIRKAFRANAEEEESANKTRKAKGSPESAHKDRSVERTEKTDLPRPSN